MANATVLELEEAVAKLKGEYEAADTATDKVIAEAADAEVDLVETAVATAEAKAKAEVEAKTITTLKVELATIEKATIKANNELAAANAKLLSHGLKFKGAYSELVTYQPEDIVTETGKPYVFVKPSEESATVALEVKEGNAVPRS